MPLKDVKEILFLTTFTFFLFPGCHEVSSSALPHPSVMTLFHYRSTNNGANDCGFNPLKSGTKIVFPFILFPSSVCQNDKKSNTHKYTCVYVKRNNLYLSI
jgi:hypothetical protein